MEISVKKPPISLVAVVAMITQCTHATVITDSHIALTDGFGLADYALTVYQDEAAMDTTTTLFNVSGQTLFFETTNIDEGSDWYLTSLLDPFSRATIDGGNFPVFVRATPTGSESAPLTAGLGDFYLGVNTGNSDGSWGGPGIPPRNLYGWVHLNFDGSGLSMIGNAMSYQGEGIVIGTTQVIPEPSVVHLLLFSLSAIFAQKRSARVIDQRAFPSRLDTRHRTSA